MTTSTTTRVAVRAVTSGTVGVGVEHTEAWAILEMPTQDLGNYDAEADVLYGQLPHGFVGDVIVVDENSEGYAPGCSTWSRCDEDELEQARAEHWNCEHTLFGSTPAEGWTQITDAVELDACEALEMWEYRTGEYAAGEYEALVARYTWDPETYRLTVTADEHGPMCEQSEIGTDLAEAKRVGIATIVLGIESFEVEYHATTSATSSK